MDEAGESFELAWDAEPEAPAAEPAPEPVDEAGESVEIAWDAEPEVQPPSRRPSGSRGGRVVRASGRRAGSRRAPVPGRDPAAEPADAPALSDLADAEIPSCWAR
ncbi:MAG: hypothetical protein R3F60_04850 [bacterium]